MHEANGKLSPEEATILAKNKYKILPFYVSACPVRVKTWMESRSWRVTKCNQLTSTFTKEQCLNSICLHYISVETSVPILHQRIHQKILFLWSVSCNIYSAIPSESIKTEPSLWVSLKDSRVSAPYLTHHSLLLGCGLNHVWSCRPWLYLLCSCFRLSACCLSSEDPLEDPLSFLRFLCPILSSSKLSKAISGSKPEFFPWPCLKLSLCIWWR